jgi:hypothetical protein
MSDDFTDRLSAMQSAFKEAEVDADPFALPEPGDYQALVNEFDIFETDSGLLFKTRFQIINDPVYSGRFADTIHNLEDPARIGFLKTHLSRLGADVSNLDLADLRPGSEYLREFLDVTCDIAVKDSKKTNPNTGKPYRNVYLNGRLGSSDIPEPGKDDFVHSPADRQQKLTEDIGF